MAMAMLVIALTVLVSTLIILSPQYSTTSTAQTQAQTIALYDLATARAVAHPPPPPTRVPAVKTAEAQEIATAVGDMWATVVVWRATETATAR